jgi:hypothetical protein
MTDIHTALNRAFQLGQTYWQQADSESYKQNAKLGIAHYFGDKLDAAIDAARAAKGQG